MSERQMEMHFILSQEHSQQVKQINGWVEENWQLPKAIVMT